MQWTNLAASHLYPMNICNKNISWQNLNCQFWLLPVFVDPTFHSTNYCPSKDLSIWIKHFCKKCAPPFWVTYGLRRPHFLFIKLLIKTRPFAISNKQFRGVLWLSISCVYTPKNIALTPIVGRQVDKRSWLNRHGSKVNPRLLRLTPHSYESNNYMSERNYVLCTWIS